MERLSNIKELIEKLDSTVANTYDHFVPRREWDGWASTRDREFKQLHETVAKLAESIAAEAETRKEEYETWRAQQETRRVPWTAVGSFVVAGVALLITLIQSVGA